MRSFKIYQAALSVSLAVPAICLGLTSGPNLPEYNNYEPLEATDMVNLSSGNFSWTLPVMTVPGPALGFPLILNYHAGIGQKDEASWVGLGWNLQAGAITRQVNKLPDDFKDVEITEKIRSNTIHGWSASVGYMGATVGIAFHGFEATGGTVGFNVMSLVTQGQPVGANLTLTAGFGSMSGATGVSAGLGVSVGSGSQGLGLGAGAGLSISVTQGAGFEAGGNLGVSIGLLSISSSASTTTGVSTSVSLGGIGVSLGQNGGLSVGAFGASVSLGTTVRGQMNSTSTSFVIPIPTKVGIFTFGMSFYSSWIEGLDSDHYYGFLYADSKSMQCVGQSGAGTVNCLRGNGENQRRHEFLAADLPLNFNDEVKIMKTAEDTYLVSAQGISGVFKPYRKEDGDYVNTLEKTSKLKCDFLFFGCDRKRIDRSWELEKYGDLLSGNPYSDRSDIYWRYADDAAGAEYTPQGSFGDGRDATAEVSWQSKKIVPILDPPIDGRLVGFRITNTNGTTYVFDLPLYNAWEYKTGRVSDGNQISTTQEINTRYAYAWLLTSIQSPDYVDMSPKEVVGDGDIGGWVKFTYGDGTGASRRPMQYWRTPYYNPASTSNAVTMYAPAGFTNSTKVNGDDVIISQGRQSAEGIKEIAYLRTVETPTHRAVFTTSARLDNAPFKGPKSFIVETGPGLTGSLNPETGHGSFTLNPGPQQFPGIEDSKLLSGELVDLEVTYSFAVTNGAWYSDDYGSGCVTQGFTQTLPLTGYAVGSLHNFTFGYEFTGEFVPHEACTAGLGSGSIVSVTVTSRKPQTNSSRKLESITLMEKASNTEISHVKFGTNYSLSRNTPNSADDYHGKLSLTSLTFGATSTGPYLPPFEFSYDFNPTFQCLSGTDGCETWYEHEKASWDRWGNFCTGCEDGYHEPDPYAAGQRHNATAWSMTKLKMPSGAVFTMTYAPKLYKYIGTEPVAAKYIGTEPVAAEEAGYWKIPVASSGTGMSRELINSDTAILLNKIEILEIRKKLTDRGLTLQKILLETRAEDNLTEVAVSSSKNAVKTGAAYARYKAGTHSCNTSILYCTPGGSTISTLNGLHKEFTAAEISGQNEIWIGMRTRVTPARPKRTYYILYAIVSGSQQMATQDVAGGIVTTRLSIQEPFQNTSHTTDYEYIDGVTSQLPATFSQYDDNRGLSGTGREFYAGGAGVYYSRVSATSSLGGRTTYHFLTPKDLPVFVGTPTTPVERLDKGGSKFSRVRVGDLSALWGSLWKKEEYAAGSETPVRVTTTKWGVNQDMYPAGFETALTASLSGKPVLSDMPKETSTGTYYVLVTPPLNANAKTWFGQQQTLSSHRYFNSLGCTVSGGCDQGRVFTTQMVYRRFMPVAQTTEVLLDNLSTLTESYQPDFYSGRTLKSRRVNSDGSVEVTQIMPAHERYGQMRALNQLEQEYAQNTYVYSPGQRSNFYQSENPQNAMSSKITVWRRFVDGRPTITSSLGQDTIYRRSSEYQWRAPLGPTHPALTIPLDGCNDVGVCSPGVFGTNWTLSKRINRYDDFGHPIDVTDGRGMTSATLYGYGQSLPTAFVKNAARSQIHYQSFELQYEAGIDGGLAYVSPARSFTGTKSLQSRNCLEVVSGVVVSKAGCTTNYSYVSFPIGSLPRNETYVASVWYYDEYAPAHPTDLSDLTQVTRPGIFIGNDVCGAGNLPNGARHPAVSLPAGDNDWNADQRATGSKKWRRLWVEFQPGVVCGGTGDITNAHIYLYASKGTPGSDVYYDELRVHPKKSLMTTYAYDVRGNMISTADVNETRTHYEYDLHGNLTGIRNDDGMLISERAKKTGKQ